jgi:hypothetical protein
MTPSLKKLCILGLATGIGNMLRTQSDDNKVIWRAVKLSEAGQRFSSLAALQYGNKG